MRRVLPAGSFAQSAGLDAESMRTTPYLRIPRSRSVFAIAQAFRTCVTKLRRSSSLPIAEPPPVGGHTGATSDPITRPREATRSRKALQLVFGRIDAGVRIEQEQIDTVELDAVDRRLCGEIEHGVEIDERFGARAALADKAGPHGVMERWRGMLGCHVGDDTRGEPATSSPERKQAYLFRHKKHLGGSPAAVIHQRGYGD